MPVPRALLLCVLLPAWGCVSEVELEATPCPCGEGYQCCTSLGLCLQGNQSCPTTYPPSSAGACSGDTDCPANEACHAWSLDSKEVAGPRQCRRTCDEPSIPCAQGESCQLAPHDALPLADEQRVPLCLPSGPHGQQDGGPLNDATGDAVPEASCDPWSCQDCPPDKVGKTFCDGTSLSGCLVSTHPTCGATCEKVELKHCTNCTESGGVITCEDHSIIPQYPCLDLPCSACPADKLTFCHNSAVSTCLRMPYEGNTCSELCLVQELIPCPTACSESSGQAFCAE